MEPYNGKDLAMTEKTSKPDFSKFTKLANEKKQSKMNPEIKGQNESNETDYRYLQVRLTKQDANRFRSLVAAQGVFVQSILIESLNLWLQTQGQSPVSDPGTGRRKS
jgi:hypothetical protein